MEIDPSFFKPPQTQAVLRALGTLSLTFFLFAWLIYYREHGPGYQAGTMSTISTALRHFKEPTKNQLTEIFFSLPPLGSSESQSAAEDVDKMDINAVLSIADGIEDSYVCDR